MIRCEQCGAEWNPPKKNSKSLSECPFCGAMLLEEEKARGYGKMDEFLGYMVKVYGEDLYRNPERLKNLIGDLYGGEERVKRLFRRALVEDKLSVKVYEIAQKPENERKPFYNRLASQFAEGNYFSLELSLKVVGSLMSGLTGEVLKIEGVALRGAVVEEKESLLDKVRDEAELGNPLSQLLLGILYDEGAGIEQDSGMAIEWYRRSAEMGNADAQYKLGEFYYYGKGIEVKRNHPKALEWYRKSAEQGNAAAQYKLGDCYYCGEKKDYAKAVEWYRKSAEQGNAAAQYKLGECYYYGKGIKQDYAKAVAWYRKSAEQGYADAQYNMGWHYEYGIGLEKDNARAMEWYRKAAEQGCVAARYYRGNG